MIEMENKARRAIYSNPLAQTWLSEEKAPVDVVAKFHHSLPGFTASKLIPLDAVAKETGVEAVYVQYEGDRWGLPSFKILGASWATNRAIVKACKLPNDVGLDELGIAARKHAIKLFAATDGNHGRAVAKMARTLGIEANIYVPNDMDQPTRDFITGEGAQMFVVDGDYDKAVVTAANGAKSAGGMLIQDTAFEGYGEIPKWIVDGYSTMLREIDDQLDTTSHMVFVSPVGVGSLAEAVVSYSKTAGRNSTVLAVEPHSAACLWESLQAGQTTTIETGSTIMSGMNCGTVSTAAWPILKGGLDASVTISDDEAQEAIVYLRSVGVAAGPCGAASLAALRTLSRALAKTFGLHTSPMAAYSGPCIPAGSCALQEVISPDSLAVDGVVRFSL